MNKAWKKTALAAFAALLAFQILSGVRSILECEDTVKTGDEFRLKCSARDPYDSFRGRYVFVNIEDLETPYLEKIPELEKQLAQRAKDSANSSEKHRSMQENSNMPLYNTPVWAVLEPDGEGFAKIREYSMKKPSDMRGAILMEAGYYSSHKWNKETEKYDIPRPEPIIMLRFKYGMKKYFMNEHDVKKVEKALLKETSASTPNRKDSWLCIRLKNGNYAATDLVIGGRSARDVIKDDE